MIGYTTGTFDLFHVGHLNILRAAKSMCDTLIVGVSTDEAIHYKSKKCIISLDQRMEIVRNIKGVDVVIPQNNVDKIEAYNRIKYDILFVGEDWYGHEDWKRYENEIDAKIVYLPYTKLISTTTIKDRISNE